MEEKGVLENWLARGGGGGGGIVWASRRRGGGVCKRGSRDRLV